MLLRFLVTSRARSQILRLLWADGLQASVSELARKANVSFAGAYQEVEAMRRAGLARCDRVGAKVVCRANRRHPQAALLKQLVGAQASPAELLLSDRRAARTRGWLADAGAPLLVTEARRGRPPRLETVVSEGLSLAHRDAHVARVLPVLLWRQRQHLNWQELARRATRRNERQTLGFFLELTGELGRDETFRKVASDLRDGRRKRLQPFFTDTGGGRWALALARRNTPALARKWGYSMNMSLDSFASAFSKHAAVA